MPELIESIPEARLLLMSLRSVGYTEEAAIADIIDNSISADATKIEITFDWDRRRIVIFCHLGKDKLPGAGNLRHKYISLKITKIRHRRGIHQ